MAVTLDDKLVVAISSRALFDLEEENRIFESGDDARLHEAAARAARRAGPARHRLFAGARSCCASTTRRRAAGRGGDPVAQRPGLGHARVPLGAWPTASRCSAACSRRAGRPSATCGRCGRTCSSRSTPTTCARPCVAGFPAARVLVESVRASRCLSGRGAHRLRRRRGAVQRRGRARLPGRRARRLPAPRILQGRPAAARRPVQAAAGGAAPAAAGERLRHAHPHRPGHRAQRAGPRARDPHA